MDILKTNKKILTYSLYINLFILVFSIFFFNKAVIFTNICVNLVLIGTHLIIERYSTLFYGLALTNKFAKNLNSKLEGL